MSLLGNIWVKLGLRSDDFERGIDKSHSRAERFGTAIGKISAKMVLAWAAVGVALTRMFKASVDNFNQQQAANIKLQAALQKTGSAIGANYDELRQYASELQKVNGYADDATMSAMATLTTFRSVQGRVFKDTIKAAQDMAAFMGTDLNTAVHQLGKALEAPEIGITMLRRSGVIFTKEMTDGIKRLVAEGKTAEAQMAILEEVNKRFGGEAARHAETTAGAWKRVGMAFGDLSEHIGAATNATRWLANSLASALETADKIISSEALTSWEKFKVIFLGIGQAKAADKMVAFDRANREAAKHAAEYAKRQAEGITTIEEAQRRLAREVRGLAKATSDQRKADHRAAIDAIKAEMGALNERKAKEEEDARQAAARAKEEAERLKKWREEHTGILNELKDEIAAKEKLLNMATDRSEIKRLQEEIRLLKEHRSLILGESTGRELPTLTAPGTIKAGTAPGVDTTPLKHSAEEIEVLVDKMEEQERRVEDISRMFGDAVRGGFIDAIDDLATAIGTGDWDTSAMLKTLISPLADAAIAAGTIVLGVGEGVEGLKAALTSLQGPVAIAAGAALIAAGVAAKAGLAAIAKNGAAGRSTSGSATTPYTYTGGYGVLPLAGTNAGTVEIAGTVTVKGQDIQIALANYHKNKRR